MPGDTTGRIAWSSIWMNNAVVWWDLSMNIDLHLSWMATFAIGFMVFVVPVKFAGDFIEVRRVGFLPAAFSLLVGALISMGCLSVIESYEFIIAANVSDSEVRLIKILSVFLAFILSFKYVLETTVASSVGVLVISVFLCMFMAITFSSLEMYKSGVTAYELAELAKGAIKIYIN